MNIKTTRIFASIGIFLLFAPSIVVAQKSNLEVTRCKSIDRNLPIKNLWVDEAGTKWASNTQGVFQIQSCDLSSKLPFGAGEASVLAYPYGNVDFRWNKAEMDAALGPNTEITTAFYDEAKKQLWIGTRKDGAFLLATSPQLKVTDRFNTKNTKLRSDYITYLGKDRYDRFWVGTEEGVIIGSPGKWKDDLEGYAFQRMRSHNNDVFVLADGEMWIIEQGEKWRAININEDALEGDPFDFDIADDGTLWILSRMAAKYDLQTDEFEIFSGIQYYTSEYGRFIAVDNDGAAWIATSDKGLYLIEEASAITVNILIEKEPACNGTGQDGALNVKISGGKEPYQYAWSNAQLKGANPTNVPAGEHSLTVTDAAGKTKTAEVKLDNPQLTLTVDVKKVESAPGAADALAEAKVSGGKPAYTFKWDNGETSATATKLSEGAHVLVVTDSKGCTSSATVNVSQKVAPLNLELSLASSISCNGGATTLVALTTGGKPPFSFNWNNADMKGDRPENLKAGTYNLTVTDAVGNTARALFTIPEPDPVSGTIAVQQPASTGKSDAKATVTPKGGNGGFSFKWDNGETAASAVNLAPGKHTVTITDAKGCTGTAGVDILENIVPLGIMFVESNNITCHGGTTGLSIIVNGGKPPFEYKWSNPGLTGPNPVNLPAGEYSLTVTDATGKTITVFVPVKQPEALNAVAQAQAPASTGGSNGKALVTATGGNGNFTYKWDNGETTATAAKLNPGKHSVTVSDAKGCSATASVEITENILPLSVQVVPEGAINCKGGTAALTANVGGGKGPYQYKWNNPAFTGGKPANVTAGEYTVTVSDAAGQTATAKFNLTEPAALAATAQAQAPASTGGADGKAQVTATGGNGNFTYKWDNGETTATAAKLNPGKHSVTVSDAKGCSATASVEITENILPLSVQVVPEGAINCKGGTAALTANVGGGKGPYQYKWNNPAFTGGKPANVTAGEYTVTVSDAAGQTATAKFSLTEPAALAAAAQAQAPASTGGADGKAQVTATGGNGNFTYKWDNGETTPTASKLAPGKHSVTVSDAKGCTATASVEITENILPLSVQVVPEGAINCKGGTAALTANVGGGKGPYQYKWNNPAFTGGKPANVTAGEYTVTVSDAAGQTATAKFNLTEPAALSASAEVKSPASAAGNDGKASVSASGGSGNFTYKWDNGETSETAEKLNPGKHSVTVSDAKGCSTTVSIDVSENILPLEVDASATRTIQCADETTPLKVTVKGGKPPFTYKWDKPEWKGAEVPNATAGTYAVLVTDAKGSTQSAVVLVKAPDPLKAEVAKKTGATTERTEDGKATLAIRGGTPPYSVKWDNGENQPESKKLTLGLHRVTVTDAVGCNASLTVDIGKRILPDLTPGMLSSGSTVRIENLRFDGDSSNVKEEFYPTLDEVHEFMLENGKIVIEIGGHTNNIPPDEYCDRLSTARAKAVAEYLIDKGIDEKRVLYKGYGKRKPVATNTTPEGRALNQRVEIKILSLGG